MQKNILIVIGHPRSGSLCESLAHAYQTGAQASGHDTRLINLSSFASTIDRNLLEGENTGDAEHPQRNLWREDVKRADHMIFVFPTRRYTVPAILKGWFDRLFTPKFSHQYTGYLKRKKLLEGRTASFYSTCGGPWYTYIATLGHPGIKRMRWTCRFVGIKGKSSHLFTNLAPGLRTPEEIDGMIQKMERFGRKGK